MSGVRIRTREAERQKPTVVRATPAQTQRQQEAASPLILRAPPGFARPSGAARADLLRLQRMVGNRRLQRLRTGTAIIQRDLSEADKKVEQQVKDLVKDGKYDDALTLICKTYGFTGPNFEIKVVPAMDDAWAKTKGEIKAGAKQTLEIGKDLFSQDFTFIVRTIGHEFQHLKQRSQEKPIENQKEREFLAWGWEALGEEGPAYALDVAAVHARKALEYFRDMPEDRQKLDSNKQVKKKLEKLIKKAEEAAGH